MLLPVRSSDSSVGVSDLVLGRVDVGVTVVDVAELILSAVLGGSWGGDGGSGNGGGVSSGIADTCGVGVSSSIAEGKASIGSNDSSASAGNGGQNDLEKSG